jgi:choice-of-anchor B domain-containing protein
MKKISTLLFSVLFISGIVAQVDELNLIYNWDDTTIIGSSFYDNKYNEIWGFEQSGEEYAVIGSTSGVHFFKMDDLEEMGELENAFVFGAADGGAIIHRDYHDYNGYLYAVADEGPSTLQIIKLDDLPATTSVVYDSNQLLRTTHNIFIDTSSAILYAMGGAVFEAGNYVQFSLRLISLEDPENPTLISSFPNQSLSLPNVHDGYFEEGIAYLNCGYSGLYIVDFTDPSNPELLGTMTNYPQSGYNHSGWPHETEPVYYLADENHGKSIKVVDVSDFTDMEVVNLIDAETDNPGESIPHNLIVMDNYLYVSYYFDGVQVYDISDAKNPVRVASYDTYPIVDFSDDYNGNWGVYPFPGSKRLVASDMRNGFFAFDAYDLSSTKDSKQNSLQISVYPNPFTDRISFSHEMIKAESSLFNLYDLNGRLVFSKKYSDDSIGEAINIELPNSLSTGFYSFEFKQQTQSFTGKMIK